MGLMEKLGVAHYYGRATTDPNPEGREWAIAQARESLGRAIGQHVGRIEEDWNPALMAQTFTAEAFVIVDIKEFERTLEEMLAEARDEGVREAIGWLG